MARRLAICALFVVVFAMPFAAAWRHCPGVRRAVAASVAGERQLPLLDYMRVLDLRPTAPLATAPIEGLPPPPDNDVPWTVPLWR